MEESFVLSVTQKDYNCTFQRWGYSYRINVNVEGSEVVFEPDEERNFRAISVDGKLIDTRLLAAIAEKLEETFR